MDRFFNLLEDLGSLINVPLYPDSKRMCRISVDHELHIQMEDESDKDRMLIAAFIDDVSPGKFRENVLRESLKEDNLFPRLGTLAYSERNNKLCLFTHLYYPGLKADKLADVLEMFIEKCFLWKKGLQTGALPPRDNVKKK